MVDLGPAKGCVDAAEVTVSTDFLYVCKVNYSINLQLWPSGKCTIKLQILFYLMTDQKNKNMS